MVPEGVLADQLHRVQAPYPKLLKPGKAKPAATFIFNGYAEVPLLLKG
ncbi:hypothetical protein [Saccharothrix sp. ALI-22-I]|nr:hypothetical protein [Saccharothrix sp. ALI-22-I]